MEQRPPLHLGTVAIKKGASGSPSTKVVNFIYDNCKKFNKPSFGYYKFISAGYSIQETNLFK